MKDSLIYLNENLERDLQILDNVFCFVCLMNWFIFMNEHAGVGERENLLIKSMVDSKAFLF